jgi:hypothetical protein
MKVVYSIEVLYQEIDHQNGVMALPRTLQCNAITLQLPKADVPTITRAYV